VRDNIEEFIADYTKVFEAYRHAPPEERRKAMQKALHEIWEQRRREKKTSLQEENQGKK
jgi:hypothetical protein